MNNQGPALFEAPLVHETGQNPGTCTCQACSQQRELASEFEWEADSFDTSLYPGLPRGHEDLTESAIARIGAMGIPGIDAIARQALLRGVTRPDTGHVIGRIPTNPIKMIGQQFVKAQQKRHALRRTFDTSTPAALVEIANHLRLLHNNALRAASSGNRAGAFEWIGEALHLIQDSFSGAHTQRGNIGNRAGPHPIIKVRFFGRKGLGFSQAPGEHQVFSPLHPYRGQRVGDIRDKIRDARTKKFTQEAVVAIDASVDFLRMLLSQLRRRLPPGHPTARAELQRFINWHLSTHPMRLPC